MSTLNAAGDDYLRVAQDLLPRGWAWPRDPDATLTGFWRSIAEEFSRTGRRMGDLLDIESHPGAALEMLTDWERVAGLPDPCAGQAATLSERRNRLIQKLTARGGQSRQYYIDVAAVLGFEITITEFRPFTANSACDQPCRPDYWRYGWQVNAPAVRIYQMDCNSACNEPLRSWGNQALECTIRRLKPAHSVVIFAYAPTADEDWGRFVAAAESTDDWGRFSEPPDTIEDWGRFA
ncbi:MAG: DUF2313 domain-containing protein [Rhodospirillales bacterium]|nr:DUF2313 domain-containing protein [Rhodospirillales bacterium]